MKKIFGLLALCVLCAPYAAGWGFVPEVFYATNWFAEKLGQGQVIQPVCVTTYVQGEYLPGLPADSRVSQEKLVSEFENALNYWFTKPREFLQKSGRSAEFADFLSALPQHITLQLQDECSNSGMLRLVYAPREWYINVQQKDGRVVGVTHKARYTVPAERISKDVAWTEVSQKGGTINLYERLDLINLQQVLAHESGHLFGLTSQYGFAPYMFPGENTSSTFAYFHVIGKNTAALNRTLLNRKPASLMGGTQYHAQALKTMWPDDVDGLINAVDMIQAYQHGLLSPRVVNGWKSFSLADKKVGYALALPFQYTASNTVPAEVVANATDYMRGKLAGLETPDFALLQAWYKQTNAAPVYAAVQASDLHNRQLAQNTQREVKNTLQAPLVRAEAVPLTVLPTAQELRMPDLMPLTLPDTNGQTRTLTPVRNVADEDPDCNFYLIITDKEMSWFEKEYGSVLARAQRKTVAHKKLTKKETRITRWYKQMQENKRKTAKCWVEPAN